MPPHSARLTALPKLSSREAPVRRHPSSPLALRCAALCCTLPARTRAAVSWCVCWLHKRLKRSAAQPSHLQWMRDAAGGTLGSAQCPHQPAAQHSSTRGNYNKSSLKTMHSWKTCVDAPRLGCAQPLPCSLWAQPKVCALSATCLKALTVGDSLQKQ